MFENVSKTKLSFELQIIIHEDIIQFDFSHLPRGESKECQKGYM